MAGGKYGNQKRPRGSRIQKTGKSLRCQKKDIYGNAYNDNQPKDPIIKRFNGKK